MRLLLFSNSTNYGEEYLGYTISYIRSFIIKKQVRAVFIPYAGVSLGFDTYFEQVRNALNIEGLEIKSLHDARNKQNLINSASLFIVGGGNTFCLLKTLQDEGTLNQIKQQVHSGIPYIGWSAGSNIVCPTICTTNDMPIVEPKSFRALDLLPFQINPHYNEHKPNDFSGETRLMRINEFLIVNPGMHVVGLREGSLLHIEGDQVTLKGSAACKIFKYNMTPYEIEPGNNLTHLVR